MTHAAESLDRDGQAAQLVFLQSELHHRLAAARTASSRVDGNDRAQAARCIVRKDHALVLIERWMIEHVSFRLIVLELWPPAVAASYGYIEPAPPVPEHNALRYRQ